MAPILLLAFALLAQDAPAATSADDGPVATAAPRKQDVAPLPIQGGPVSAPSDDYGYVGWCFGAVSGYVDLYDRAMPEVIRIERAWPTPGTEENIREVYPAQKRDAVASLALFRRAIEAAEKASPTPIAPQGAAAIKRGRGVWTGATTVPKAQLAQFWMSWSPPAKCEETAKALEARANLFGQALTANAAAAAPLVAAPPPPEPAPPEPANVPLAEAPPAEAPAPAAAPEAPAEPSPPVETPVDEPTTLAAEPAAPAAATPAAPAAPSAIDDLLPVAAEAEPVAEPAPPPAPVAEAEKPAAQPVAQPVATPAKPKPTRKPGLRDTLRGLRGQQ
jgi:hypothetical protein